MLFDLDGVIIDSEKEYTRIWSRVNEEFPTGVEGFATKIKGTTLESILSKYFPDTDVQRRVVARLYEEEGKMVYDYCPGARELLEALHDAGIPIALFTSSNEVKMAHLYHDRPELRNAFDFIITADKVKHSKPAPDGYLMAAAGLGLEPRDCVVIEDALQGVKAGRAAGCKVIGVAGTLKAESLAPYSDMVVNTLEEVDVDSILELLNKD